MTGSSFEAQSSSLNKSVVAARAINAALRAWTKGSRSDLANAAESTLARFCLVSAWDGYLELDFSHSLQDFGQFFPNI